MLLLGDFTMTRQVRHWISLTLCAITLSILLPAIAHAQSPKVQKAMVMLKAKTAELGAPALNGEDAVGDKKVPALYFGTTKMNNNFKIVDLVQQKMGSAATLFVKVGDDFVRVATNVKKADGSRAIGTVLDPKGKAIAAIQGGGAYYGDADILGKAYVTGYEPIRNAGGQVIGIYFVGYPKAQ